MRNISNEVNEAVYACSYVNGGDLESVKVSFAALCCCTLFSTQPLGVAAALGVSRLVILCLAAELPSPRA